MMSKRESRRKVRVTPTKPVVIVVCDGAKTEPIYFKNFKSRDKLFHIKVVHSGKNYLDLIKKGIHESDGVEGACDVWCVSDVDADPNTPYNESSKNQQLKEFKEQARKYGFQIALSNPCFELWYLLHFGYSTSNLPTYKSLEQKLSVHLPNYSKTKNYFSQLSDTMDYAISNAKKLEKHHADLGIADFASVAVNPYTDVWQLVEQIK
jgi:hypothetical protein